MGNMVRLCSAHSTTESHECCPPVSIRPQYALEWDDRSCDVQQCAEHAWATGSDNCITAALVSGFGTDATDVATAASSSLARLLQNQQQPLTPDALTAAFQQCHAQLLQQQQQQQQQQQRPFNISTSGASCLVAHIDPGTKQLLAASAGLCQAVLARSAVQGSTAGPHPGSTGGTCGTLTVLELTPRLALGYNVAETSRLDAHGSSICYSHSDSSSSSTCYSRNGLAAAAAEVNKESQQQQQQAASCPGPVLLDPTGKPLPGLGASRVLGFSAASSAGVLPTPLVTTWRLCGSEAFVVLGSPELWAAMNPAEVVDYVAAVLASGACSTAGSTAVDGSTAAACEGSTGVSGTSESAACVTAAECCEPLQQQQQQQQAAVTALQQEQQQQQQGEGIQLRGDAGQLLSDLLTLEAQERLNLRLTSSSNSSSGFLSLTAGGAQPEHSSSSSSTGQQVVPDVTAIVLLLPGVLPGVVLHHRAVQVDRGALAEELSGISRGCPSNAEAQALQASWYSSTHQYSSDHPISSSSSSVAAIPSSSSNSSSSRGTASMSSSTDSTCSTAHSYGLRPAGLNSSSSSSATAAAGAGTNTPGKQAQAQGTPLVPFAGLKDCTTSDCTTSSPQKLLSAAGPHSTDAEAQQMVNSSSQGDSPAHRPPCPALRCILPTLTVAGHCWPPAFWPTAAAAVKVPAGLAFRQASSAAAAAAAAAAPGQQSPACEYGAEAGTGYTSRPVGFALSSRLSIELDVTHRPSLASSGSISSLAAQCALADAAAAAADDDLTGGATSFDQIPPASPADDQAVIVHKVRLSGPNELESLLFGRATTSHPDTTVARILKPKSSSSGVYTGRNGHKPLAHACSWAAPTAYSSSGALGCYPGSGTGAGWVQQQQQQMRSSHWPVAANCGAGVSRTLVDRSASINISALARRVTASGAISCSSSAASGSGTCTFGHVSLKASGSAEYAAGRDSLAGAAAAYPGLASADLKGISSSSSTPAWSPGQRRYSEDMHMAGANTAAAHGSQPGAAGGAGAAGTGVAAVMCQPSGRVSKARSFQALSALQAAGSGELCTYPSAAAAAADASANAQNSRLAWSQQPTKALAASMGGWPDALAPAAASADAAALLRSYDHNAGINSSSSSVGGGVSVYNSTSNARRPIMSFRPAFRSEGQSKGTTSNPNRPLALRQRFSDSDVVLVPAQQQQQQQGSASPLQQQGSLSATLACADSLSLENQTLDLPEGKVRGGLVRSSSRSSSSLAAAAYAADQAAAAAAAAAADEPADSSCKVDQAMEGLEKRVRGGLQRQRQQQQQQQQAVLVVPDAGLTSQGTFQQAVEGLEPCVRGGQVKASRMKHSWSSPELKGLAGPVERPRRVRHTSNVLPPSGVVLPPASSTAGAVPTPGSSTAAGVQQQQQGVGVQISLPDASTGLTDSAAAAAASEQEAFGAASPPAGDMTGRSPSHSCLLAQFQQQQQQQQQGACAVSAFASASAWQGPSSPTGSLGRSNSLARSVSNELPALRHEGSAGADGAVHGGELGEQALEGQMHGGRRSKSMSVSSLLLTSSLPSSADDDGTTLTASCSLSPSSKQQQMHRQHSAAAAGLVRNNTFNSSFSCSSNSWRQSILSPANSGLLPAAHSLGYAQEAARVPAATFGGSFGAYGGQASLSGAAAAAEGASQGCVGFAGGLQRFASSDDLLNGASVASSLLGPDHKVPGSNPTGSIEVMRMPSGSFTRVRFAASASAPVGAPGEQLSTAVDSFACSPESVLLRSSCGQFNSPPAGLAAVSSSTGGGTGGASWGTSAVRGWSSPNRQVVAFSHSASTSDKAASMSGPGVYASMSAPGPSPGLNNSSSRPALPKPAWSSSRAWSSKSASRSLNGRSSSSSGGGGGGDGGGVNSIFAGMQGGSTRSSTGGLTGIMQASALESQLQLQAQPGDSSSSASAATSAADADQAYQSTTALGGSASPQQQQQQQQLQQQRQWSGGLPTLHESPATTPASSPCVSFGFAAAYEETLARIAAGVGGPTAAAAAAADGGAAGGRHTQPQQQQERSLAASACDPLCDPTGTLLLLHDNAAASTPRAGGVGPGSCPVGAFSFTPQQQQQQQQHQSPEHSATGLVLQSLASEVRCRSIDSSGGCSGGTAAASCSSEQEGCVSGVSSETFEFSRPQGGSETWEQSPLLLGNMLQR